jgi:hypothetical protein
VYLALPGGDADFVKILPAVKPGGCSVAFNLKGIKTPKLESGVEIRNRSGK